MMRKQILSLAVALLIGSTVCMAQNRQNGKADREKRMEQFRAYIKFFGNGSITLFFFADFNKDCSATFR